MGPKGPLAIVLLVLLVGSHGELIDIDALLAEEAAIGDDVRCTIKITVAEDSTNADDPMIKGFALCEGNILYDETRPLSKLEPVELAKGMNLFEKHGDMGYAYLLVTGNGHLLCTGCEFKGLPAFPASKGGSEAVIIVDNDGHTNFKKPILYLMKEGYKSVGGIIFQGNSLGEVTVGTFQECHGTKVGVLEVSGSAHVVITKSYFVKNTGEVSSNSILVRDRGYLTVRSSKILGMPAPEEFISYVLGDEASLPTDLTIVNGGAVAVIENAHLDLRMVDVEDSWGKTGGIHTTHNSFLNVESSKFANNTGLSGGAILVEGLRGHNAKVHDSNMVSNTAREGGALVALGEGNLYINQTMIQQNTARIGGGFYSDFAAPGEEEYTSCGKQTEGSRMSFDVVKFTDNVAETSGGGIHAKCSLVRMRNITVSGNSAGDFGGGIFVDTVADLDFEYTPFEGNKAGQGGSAIYAVGSILVDLENCNFTNNEVESIDFGGTVMIDGTEDVVMKNVRMEGNTAGGSGAALWLEGAEILNMEEIYVYNNSADNSGGAIYGSGVSEKVDIATMILKENNAGMSGGGLVIDKAGDVTLSSVSAMDNMAGLNGGGISIHGSGDFTATDVVVNDNEADNDCGGLRVAGFEKVSMAEVSVLGNSASGNGGGLCFKDIGTLALDDSIRVESNTAGEEGGGIHMNGASGSVSVTKTSLEGNSAAIGVAASIYNCMDVALTDLVFKDNSASFSCGSIQASAVGLLQIENVEFSGNKALEENGGAICFHDINMIALMGTTSFVNNTAAGNGGAVYVTNATVLESGSTAFFNNSGMNGGAIGGVDVSEFSSIGGNFSDNHGQGNGGGIYLDPIVYFILEDAVVLNNHALDGGGIKIGNGSLVDIQNVTFSRNTASRDGGGIMVDHFAKMDLTNVNITNNTAEANGAGVVSDQVGALKLQKTGFDFNTAFSGRGGALHLLATNVDGDDVHLNQNEAYHSGGAFLCEGDSLISMKNINFTYNFARAGQSLSAYCGCSVNVSDSEFHREKHRKHNGDFFEKKKSCAEIIHNNCLFFGAPDVKLAGWVIIVIIVVSVLFLFFCIVGIALAYYRKKYKTELDDVEDPIKGGAQEDETSEEYSTTDEETEESSVLEDEDEHPATTKPQEAPQGNAAAGTPT